MYARTGAEKVKTIKDLLAKLETDTEKQNNQRQEVEDTLSSTEEKLKELHLGGNIETDRYDHCGKSLDKAQESEREQSAERKETKRKLDSAFQRTENCPKGLCGPEDSEKERMKFSGLREELSTFSTQTEILQKWRQEICELSHTKKEIKNKINITRETIREQDKIHTSCENQLRNLDKLIAKATNLCLDHI